jgi:acetyl esterase/lipase
MAGMIAWIALLAAVQEEAPPAERVYKKPPQGELKVRLYYPPGWKASDRRPAFVFFFGGGWTQGKVDQFEPQAKYLAGRGMVAACADYRVRSRHGVTPVECVEDAKSAVRWLRKNAGDLGIDPGRIVAAGGSAGGHIAACAGIVPGVESPGEDAAVSSKPDALVLFNPVLDAGMLAPRLGGEEAARRITPNAHLEKGAPPALVLFGTKDPLIKGAEQFMSRSKELGNRAELFTAEGQSHGFFNRPPWQERTLYRVDEFLASLGYLQGKPTLEVPPAEPR